jgi:hypothetical protein
VGEAKDGHVCRRWRCGCKEACAVLSPPSSGLGSDLDMGIIVAEYCILKLGSIKCEATVV